MRREPVNTEATVFRQLGLERFESEDIPGAIADLTKAVNAGAVDTETVTVLGGLLSDQGNHSAAADLYNRFLDRQAANLSPADQLEWYRLAFDATRLAGSGAETRSSALDLLAVAAGSGDWTPILEANRRDAIEASFSTADAQLDLFEQYSYAPAVTGLPAAAIGHILSIGLDPTTSPQTSRLAERLLHALGQPEPAYAIDRARRSATFSRGGRNDVPSPAIQSPVDLDGFTILVAGGHPALRRQIERDLGRSGAAEVREIPPAWEAVRAGRDVRDRLAGADVAVLIGRRLPHSTVNQVRGAAHQLKVPVVFAETAGVAATRRAIEQWLSARD